jgi:metal-responsive CopG/Arc/MetJ family transcriptional regulator
MPGSTRGEAARKKRCTFTIEQEMLERLRAMKVRTGMSESEQIRQAIRSWLDSREWPSGGFRRANRNV